MEARSIGIALSAVAIAMFGGFVAYSLQHDALLRAQQKAAAELAAARSDAEAAEGRKNRAAGRVNEIKATYARDDEAVTKMREQIEAAEKEIMTKENELADTMKELAKVEKQIKTAVEFQRAAAVGSTYPRIELSNGKILLNAKLVRFSPQNLEFAHAAGKATVRWSILPTEIAERFRMGDDEGVDDTVIEDTDDPGLTEEQIAAAAEDAKAAAKAAEQRTLLEGRLRAIRVQIATVSASIQALSRKAAPNPAQLAGLQRKFAVLQASETELMERLARVQ